MKITLTPATEISLAATSDVSNNSDAQEHVKRLQLTIAPAVVVGAGGGVGEASQAQIDTAVEAAVEAAVAGVSQAFDSQTVWSLDHDYPYKPNVIVTDEAGRVIYASVDYVSATRVTATHNSPQSGTLRIS